jgi:hypothetical protein
LRESVAAALHVKLLASAKANNQLEYRRTVPIGALLQQCSRQDAKRMTTKNNVVRLSSCEPDQSTSKITALVTPQILRGTCRTRWSRPNDCRPNFVARDLCPAR